MSQKNTREPIEMAVGDTLSFTRELPNFSARDSWSLLYEIRGQGQAQEFSSTPDGSSHVILVDAAVTANWTPGICVLSGFAENGSTGARQQIYSGTLNLLPNVPVTTATADVKTNAQIMVEELESVMQKRATGALNESQLGETRFKFKTDKELREAHAYWYEMRKSEIALQRAKAGLPTGRKIGSVMHIINSGPLYGGQFPFGRSLT